MPSLRRLDYRFGSLLVSLRVKGMISDKKKAKKRVLKILKKLDLTPVGSISKALNDPTVRAYLGVVKNKKGKRAFLKVRVQDLEIEKNFFGKLHYFGQVLNQNPKLSINKRVPKLLDSSFGGEIDYLLYQYLEGEDMGTRRYYDVIRLKMNEIDDILYLLKGFLAIPVDLFPKNWDQKGVSYFKKKFENGLLMGIDEYLEKDEIKKLKKISQSSLLDNYLKFFSHGDFKPNNFLRTKKGIFVVDFEITSITNPFFDFFSIWGYAIRKPRWRAVLMKRFLDWYQFKNREEELFKLVKILFLLRELTSLLKYLKKDLTKVGIRVAKRYLPQRVEELKTELKNFCF